MKKKILFIATGGTIASTRTAEGLKPGFEGEELLKFFPEATAIADIDVFQLCHLDSTNLHPKYWTLMAQAVADNHEKYDGFVIGHGTDTLGYSSAALSLALRGIGKPVIFTGSVLPLEDPGTDAKRNFTDSVRVAASDKVKEVCVCFEHTIIKGTHLRKITNEATQVTNEKIGVYSSINLHFIGTLEIGKVIENEIYFTKNGHPKNTKLELKEKFDENTVGLVKIFPGLSSDVLDTYKDKKAVVIEGFGPGNIPFDYSHWLEKIAELSAAGIAVFVNTQCPFGEVDMSYYEVGQEAQKAGATPCYDMITETALVKLMWITGNYPDYDATQIKELFLTNLCREINRSPQ